jgi:hypothetical protein
MGSWPRVGNCDAVLFGGFLVPTESVEFQAAKADVANMPDGMLTELRSLYHTEETPLFIVRTFGAVCAAVPAASFSLPGA